LFFDLKCLIYKRIKHYFTLLELVCVLAISLLIIGIVIGRVGKTPAFISLDNCVNGVQEVLSEASNQAVVNGKEIIVRYNNRQLFNKNNQYLTKHSVLKNYIAYTIPETIAIEFPNLNEEDSALFIFYPDGSASAPTMLLHLRKHSVKIKISKLTGVVSISYL
jgi:hypothetical protein